MYARYIDNPPHAPTMTPGKVYEVHQSPNVEDCWRVTNDEGREIGVLKRRFKVVPKPAPVPPSQEADPTGRDPHAPGAKLDAGKVRPSLVIEGMARAIWSVAEVATFGAAKYTPGGWVLVPNGQERYSDAGYRHVLKRAMGEDTDPDSKLLHLQHEAWNALAKLDLYLREQEKVKTE